jgi:hypothetical protein
MAARGGSPKDGEPSPASWVTVGERVVYVIRCVPLYVFEVRGHICASRPFDRQAGLGLTLRSYNLYQEVN